ncbi:MAG: hypothetical protein ABR501_05250 [Pyrinomonadaceae bacterium]
MSGKLYEHLGWDGFPDGDVDGPPQGNVTLAGFASVMRAQPQAVAYIVAYNLPDTILGTWRRVAKQEARNLEGYGIQSERIKIIFGGTRKTKEDEGQHSQEAKVQLWLLRRDASPPVKEAKPERLPTKALQIGFYQDYLLKYPENERRVFEEVTDALRVNEELTVYIIARPSSLPLEMLPDDLPDIEPLKLVQKWKVELTQMLGFKESRIIVIPAAANEANEGTVEIWVVPPDAALPDPYATNDEGEPPSDQQ